MMMMMMMIMIMMMMMMMILIDRFYVGCDLCNNWFHGDCVGISESQAESMDEFICDDCKRQQHGVEQEELYCLCKQPYDESK